MYNNSDYRSESDYTKTDYVPPYHGKKISSFLLFLFSFLPGANYMFMGLMKKGIFAMSSFFMSIYLISYFHLLLFIFTLPIIWFYSFFDGFRIKRNLNAGIYVDDNIDPIINFIKKYTFQILIVLLAIFAFSFISTFFNTTLNFFGISRYYYGTRISSILLPLIIIIVGYLFIRQSSSKKNNVIDKRNEN